MGIDGDRSIDSFNAGAGDRSDRVLLLPPTTRDGDAILKVLASAQIQCFVVKTVSLLCEAVGEGAGIIIISEEAVTDGAGPLAAYLHQQPVWSDLPVLVLSRSGVEPQRLAASLATLGNVSVVERPLRVNTLLSLVRSSLRARARQYEVREQFSELVRTTRALSLSEQRYRALATASSNVAYGMSADWSMLLPLDGRGLVKSNAEPIRGWLEKNIPSDEHVRVREAINRAIAGKTLFELVVRQACHVEFRA